MHKVQHAVKLEPDKYGSHVVTRIQGRGGGERKTEGGVSSSCRALDVRQNFFSVSLS